MEIVIFIIPENTMFYKLVFFNEKFAEVLNFQKLF